MELPSIVLLTLGSLFSSATTSRLAPTACSLKDHCRLLVSRVAFNDVMVDFCYYYTRQAVKDQGVQRRIYQIPLNIS
jgi:hypothetical protein